ncbi:conserved hypothetical protein [Neospora caninum Liverpool]|uniref:Histone lysine methyltransferase, SET, putative n=1 Tax=Neospora caninum (strain Liverpool) TaxID=572307 RepID=F0VG78_NEOCL|nr:conserved hypothetical protein [Neospora caninum Liverpool]CBZ52722.1 conserved hypothetical protein [Neospora caninum Liverpool]CEL66702.1 TPA: histone lysine methyltransferase, SET, putative [Neospora caninum Liverpool]|eukprot:XP_003882754.1 conserved hypothetical protein [Neospora caninum Liverpool]
MEDLQDYALMTEAYDFSVAFDACKGKFLQAKRALEPQETLLVEVPLIAWPIGASVPLSQASFCENCLKLKPFHAPPPAPPNASLSSPPRAEANRADGSSPPSTAPVSDSPHCRLGDASPCRPQASASAGSPPSAAHSSLSSPPSLASPGEDACELTVQGVQCWFCSPHCLATALGGDCLMSLRKSLPSPESRTARALAAAVGASLDGAEGGRKRRGAACATAEQRKLHARDANNSPAAPEDAASRDDCSASVAPARTSTLADERASVDPGADAHTEERKLVGGWMSVLSPAALHQLRETAQPASPSHANPLPVEAVARAIARIAAQTRTLLLSCPGISLEAAFAAASRPFQRLAVPALGDSAGACTFDFSALLAAVDAESGALAAALAKPLQETVGAEAARLLLHRDTLLHLKSALALNSQAINIWGASTDGALMVIRGGGVYTLHACVNHSCEPNCAVSSWGPEGGDSTLTVTTVKAVEAGEELTISYVDEALPVRRRRQLLETTFGFACTCPRCMRESASDPTTGEDAREPET